MHELIIFTAFYASIIGVEGVYHKSRAHLHLNPAKHPKVAKHLALMGTVVTHPAFIETVKVYAGHLLVYSGYILPAH